MPTAKTARLCGPGWPGAAPGAPAAPPAGGVGGGAGGAGALPGADGSAPSVLYVRVSSSGCKVKNSRDNVLGEMLADLGCDNIADREDSLLENLSLEVILQEDPDYIFLVYQTADPAVAEAVADETLRSSPAWASLRAVQEGRCYVMDPTLYNLKPNARWGEAYEKLADILYPAA